MRYTSLSRVVSLLGFTRRTSSRITPQEKVRILNQRENLNFHQEKMANGVCLLWKIIFKLLKQGAFVEAIRSSLSLKKTATKLDTVTVEIGIRSNRLHLPLNMLHRESSTSDFGSIGVRGWNSLEGIMEAQELKGIIGISEERMKRVLIWAWKLGFDKSGENVPLFC